MEIFGKKNEKEAKEILEKLITAKDDAENFGDLIATYVVCENRGDFDYDLLYSPGITAPEVQKQILEQIILNLSIEQYRKQCEEEDPIYQSSMSRMIEYSNRDKAKSKEGNENEPILTSEQQKIHVAKMRAYAKKMTNSRLQAKEKNKNGRILPIRKPFFNENTNSLKKTPKKLSTVFCSNHNPWGSIESRRNYKNDSRRLNEFNMEFEKLVYEKIKNKICNVYLTKLFYIEYKEWKDQIIKKITHENLFYYDYSYWLNHYSYIGEIFGLKKLRNLAYLNVTKSTLEKIEELQNKGITNQSEIARQLGLTRKAVSMALSRKKQNAKMGV